MWAMTPSARSPRGSTISHNSCTSYLQFSWNEAWSEATVSWTRPDVSWQLSPTPPTYRHKDAERTYCTLTPFSFSSLRLAVAVLNSAMATQTMNVDKENPDGRRKPTGGWGGGSCRGTRTDLVTLSVVAWGGMDGSKPPLCSSRKI